MRLTPNRLYNTDENNIFTHRSYYRRISSFAKENFLLLLLLFLIHLLFLTTLPKDRKIHLFLPNYLSSKQIQQIRLLHSSSSSSVNLSSFEYFIDNLTNKEYIGTWNSNDTDESELGLNGIAYFSFIYHRYTNPDYLGVNFRFLKEKYIEHWISVYGKVKIEEMKIHNETYKDNNTYVIIEGDFTSITEKGKVFKKTNQHLNCSSHLMFKYLSLSNNKLNYTNNINGSISSSSCNTFNSFQFTLSQYEPQSEHNEIKKYSTFLSIISLLNASSTLYVTLKLKNSEMLAQSFSLCTIYQSIIFNLYICLCNFYLSLNYNTFLIEFLLPTVTSFLGFFITDIKILYTVWKIKNARLFIDFTLVRRKLVQFYCIFYEILFISIFYMVKFFFDKRFTLIGIAFTWIPQIIYNAQHNIKMSFPFIYIIITSLYRFSIPCYLHGYAHNFFKLKPDYLYIAVLFVSMATFVMLMYSQIVYGSRWFLPVKWQGSKFDFYKSKEELIKEKGDVKNIECVICLNSLLVERFGNEEGNVEVIGNDDFDVRRVRHERKEIVKIFWKVLMEFHEKERNRNKKEYMVTPCAHAFHTKCLEEWFLQKKECPNCRAEINVNY